MKIFMGMVEVAGFYGGLKQGFRELGVDSFHAVWEPHPYQYEQTDHHPLLSMIQQINVHLRKKNPNRFMRTLLFLLLFPLKVLFFLWALYKFDVFLFGFNSTFFNYRELKWLKRFNKKIVFQFHGSDSRPPYLNGLFINTPFPAVLSVIEKTKYCKKTLRIIERYADATINIPPHAQLFEKPFIQWLKLGIPCGSPTEEATPPSPTKRPQILHAPSKKTVKGTETILKITEELRNEGLVFDLKLIHGKPNQEVLQALQSCDIVIDQLFADYAMPGFSCEAAAAGKPVLLAGYAAPFWEKWLVESERPKTLYCLPESFKEQLRMLLKSPQEREQWGKKGQTFLKECWSKKQVAARYLKVFRDEIPSDWWFDPNDISYFLGVGIEKEKLRRFLKQYIETGGPQALHLEDKPNLKAALLSFIKPK